MEFVIAAPLIFAVLFLGIEVAVAFYEFKALDKAAQLGARIAVVRDPPVTGLPANLRNIKSATGSFGMRCNADPTNCDPWPGGPLVTCTGGACGSPDADAAFAYLVGEMQKLHPGIAPGDVTVTYRNIGLGYAGGPIIPAVTVTVTRTAGANGSFTLGWLSGLRTLYGGGGNIIGAGDLVVRASFTGEDMCSLATPPGCG